MTPSNPKTALKLDGLIGGKMKDLQLLTNTHNTSRKLQ